MGWRVFACSLARSLARSRFQKNHVLRQNTTHVKVAPPGACCGWIFLGNLWTVECVLNQQKQVVSPHVGCPGLLSSGFPCQALETHQAVAAGFGERRRVSPASSGGVQLEKVSTLLCGLCASYCSAFFHSFPFWEMVNQYLTSAVFFFFVLFRFFLFVAYLFYGISLFNSFVFLFIAFIAFFFFFSLRQYADWDTYDD